MGYVTAQQMRLARERTGMNQQEAAAYLGVGYRTYQRWESGAMARGARDIYLEKLKAYRKR